MQCCALLLRFVFVKGEVAGSGAGGGGGGVGGSEVEIATVFVCRDEKHPGSLCLSFLFSVSPAPSVR